MVDVAMYDAVNGLAGRPREFALVPPKRGSDGDPTAAAATAAHDVLVALYPSRAATYDAQLASDLATVKSSSASRKGQAWGSYVAAAVVSARSNDGSSGSEIQPAGSGQGHYRTAWDAHFRHLQPFAIDDPQRYVDVHHAAARQRGVRGRLQRREDRRLQRARPAGLRDLQLLEAQRRFEPTSRAPGSRSPRSVSAERGLSLADTARLFALESMALADVVAPDQRDEARLQLLAAGDRDQRGGLSRRTRTLFPIRRGRVAPRSPARRSTTPGTARSAQRAPRSWPASSAPTRSRSRFAPTPVAT